MAHSRSARKRIRQALKRSHHNKPIKTQSRSYVTRAIKLIDGGDTAVAREAVQEAVVVLDRAAQKGIIHKNTAARRKSRLARKINRAEAGSPTTPQ